MIQFNKCVRGSRSYSNIIIDLFCFLLIIYIFFPHPDTSGTVKKTGGMFKEKLRELGGLDAVFDVVVDCHAVIEV